MENAKRLVPDWQPKHVRELGSRERLATVAERAYLALIEGGKR